MIELVPLLATALGAGLLGSAHCLGMCSGISGMFAVHASAVSLRSQLPRAVAYNSGRILSYVFFGALIATIGRTFVDLIPTIASPLRLASGLLIIAIGLQIAFRWRILAPIESAGAALWNRVAPATKGLFPVTTTTRALGLGLIWGCLPCGLVYSVLLVAATTAQPVDGGLIMIAFGLGTMPAMMLTGLSAAKLSAIANRRRVAAGLLIIALGLATIVMPLTSLITDGSHATSMPH